MNQTQSNTGERSVGILGNKVNKHILNSFFVLGVIITSLSITTFNSYAAVDDMFNPINDFIKTIITLIVDKIIIWGGILAIIIQLGVLIWRQMSGENTHKMGSSIFKIFGTILIVILAMWVKTNGITLFNK